MRPAPVKITSLADGVKAKGFADMLRRAESLMKEGKFTSALDEYEAAQQVAPNNPLIWLGRANAELGAGYYSKAEQSVRQALSLDPALLIAQVDLRSMISQARREAIVKELKELARQQPKDVGLPLLLSYLAYNTGNEAEANIYLQEAEHRSNGKDYFLKLLRTHWRFPDPAETR